MDFVEFFAGGGGAHCGLRSAGLTPRLAVEWDEDAIQTLKINDHACPIDSSDMFKSTVAEVLERHGIGRDFRGLIWLSPPCQGLSQAGKKLGIMDRRNRLLFKVSQAAAFAPGAWIVMEQVPSLMNLKNRPLWRRLKRRIKALGREKRVWVLNAQNFGLAQRRTRMFMVLPPVGGSPCKRPEGLGTKVTLWDAIGTESGFVDTTLKIPLLPNEAVLMRGIPGGGNWTAERCFRAREYVLGYYMRRVKKGKETKDFSDKIYPNMLRRLSWAGVAGTVLAAWPQASGFRVGNIHPTEGRYLSNGECKTLQGFPKDYYFHGSGRKAHESVRRQIGNAVPPPIASEIGRAILGSLKTFEVGTEGESTSQRVSGRAGNALGDGIMRLSVSPLESSPRRHDPD